MSFIYCNEDKHGRWYYFEYPNGQGNAFSREKARAHRFASKAEAWEHCRNRRRGGHWSSRKWIVITLRDAESSRKAGEP